MAPLATSKTPLLTLVYIVFVSLTLTGCTWVKPTQNSESIRIVPKDRVSDCKNLGEITTYTKASVAGVLRKPAKVRQELETLAKTQAVEMDANTIVTKSEVVEGKQTYIAYRCKL